MSKKRNQKRRKELTSRQHDELMKDFALAFATDEFKEKCSNVVISCAGRILFEKHKRVVEAAKHYVRNYRNGLFEETGFDILVRALQELEGGSESWSGSRSL